MWNFIVLILPYGINFIWNYMNGVVFGNHLGNTNIVDNIKDSVVYRGWIIRKLRTKIAQLLM